MQRTKSGLKANRASQRKRVFNLRHKRAVHDSGKAIGKALAVSASDAAKLLPEFQQALDKAAKRGTITKNAAARMKSRMQKRIAALGKK
jgi:small subunit ribosomal protein S20